MAGSGENLKNRGSNFFQPVPMLKNEKKNFCFPRCGYIQFCSVSIPDYKNVICLLVLLGWTIPRFFRLSKQTTRDFVLFSELKNPEKSTSILFDDRNCVQCNFWTILFRPFSGDNLAALELLYIIPEYSRNIFSVHINCLVPCSIISTFNSSQSSQLSIPLDHLNLQFLSITSTFNSSRSPQLSFPLDHLNF